MNIIEILGSNITNNVIAMVSLLISIISLCVTFRTMTSAKQIQTEMKKMQINAVNKVRFDASKNEFIKKLEKHLATIEKAEVCSIIEYRRIFSLVSEIKGISIFSDEDAKKIKEVHEKIRVLGDRENALGEVDIKEIIEAIIIIKCILNKGEYAL